MSHPQIRVQRTVTIEEDTLVANPDALTNEEILLLVEEAPGAFTWNEVEVIAHFNIVENFA